MKKFLLLICVILVTVSCNGFGETLNANDEAKFIVSAVEQEGDVYWYHLNEVGYKKFIWDEYGYASTKRYNIGDTLTIKIELLSNSYDTVY